MSGQVEDGNATADLFAESFLGGIWADQRLNTKVLGDRDRLPPCRSQGWKLAAKFRVAHNGSRMRWLDWRVMEEPACGWNDDHRLRDVKDAPGDEMQAPAWQHIGTSRPHPGLDLQEFGELDSDPLLG